MLSCDLCKEKKQLNLYDGLWICKDCRESNEYNNKDLTSRSYKTEDILKERGEEYGYAEDYRESSEYNNKDLTSRGYSDIVPDKINPTHYTDFAIPPNEYITANKLEWEVGNVIKYVTRHDKKNGLEDLEKAAKYIELLIERKYKKGSIR